MSDKHDKLTSTLRALIQFYHQVGMGHSVVMLDGVKNSDRHPFVVVPNPSVRATLIQQLSLKKFRPITLEEIANGSLRGVSGPMAWEHTATQYLLRDCLSTITELEADLEDMKQKYEVKQESVLNLVAETVKLEAQIADLAAKLNKYENGDKL